MLAIPADPLGKALRVSENAIQAGQARLSLKDCFGKTSCDDCWFSQVTTYWDWQDVFVADKYAQDVQSWSQLLPKKYAPLLLPGVDAKLMLLPKPRRLHPRSLCRHRAASEHSGLQS